MVFDARSKTAGPVRASHIGIETGLERERTQRTNPGAPARRTSEHDDIDARC